jgi:hypothetical protein
LARELGAHLDGPDRIEGASRRQGGADVAPGGTSPPRSTGAVTYWGAGAAARSAPGTASGGTRKAAVSAVPKAKAQ